MKNSILIDLDTDRERQILFSKPPDIILPDNKEDAAKMLAIDIATLSYAIKMLIGMINDNPTKISLVNGVTKTINEILTETILNEPEKNSEESSSEETEESI